MANTDRAFGARPVRYLSGAPYNGAFNSYELPAGESENVMVGDFVILSSSDATETYPGVERLAASGVVTTGVIVGAVVGFEVQGTALNAGTPNMDVPLYAREDVKKIVFVADDPNLVFEMQEDSTGGAIATASIGLNVGVNCAVGSNTTGASGMEIDSSSVATTNSLPLQIVGRVARPDNEAATAECKYLVRINTHAYHGTVTAV